jgi:hypothetical protein
VLWPPADDSQLRTRALGGCEQPRRLRVALESTGDLGQRLERVRNVQPVAAVNERGERIVQQSLRLRPVAAAGGEASELVLGERAEPSGADARRDLDRAFGVAARCGFVAKQPVNGGEHEEGRYVSVREAVRAAPRWRGWLAHARGPRAQRAPRPCTPRHTRARPQRRSRRSSRGTASGAHRLSASGRGALIISAVVVAEIAPRFS